MAFLEIRDWKQHQHYGKRRPPWIKLYAKLVTNAAFLALPEAAQAQLMKLWLLASQMGHPLPNNPKLLAGKIGATSKFYLKEIIAGGFLTPCAASENASTSASTGADTVLAESSSPSTDNREQSAERTVVVWRPQVQGVEDRAHADAASDYATKLTVAANRAITARWGEQTRPLMAGQAYELVSVLMEQGITIDDASESIREQCTKSAKAFPPKAINWFKQGILDAAELKQARAVEASMPREDDNDPFGLRKWARDEEAKEAKTA